MGIAGMAASLGETGLALVVLRRLWRRGDSGPLLGLGLLAWALGGLALTLPGGLEDLGLSLDPLWAGAGRLLEAGAETLGWLLLYLGWERAWSREIRDGAVFWTACGAALLRLLLCALRGREWITGPGTGLGAALPALPLVLQAAVTAAAWHSVRARAPRGGTIWVLLALRLLLSLAAAGLALRLDPILVRLPLPLLDCGLLVCFGWGRREK